MIPLQKIIFKTYSSKESDSGSSKRKRKINTNEVDTISDEKHDKKKLKKDGYDHVLNVNNIVESEKATVVNKLVIQQWENIN